MFVCFCIKFFSLLVFIIFFMSKIQNHIKKRKSKKFERLCWVLSQNMFYLVPLCKWLCASMSITCFLHTHIIVGEILKSMWLLQKDFQPCHKWLVNDFVDLETCIDLCLYIFPLFYFCLKSSPNLNLQMKRDIELQKLVTHTSIWLGKRESHQN